MPLHRLAGATLLRIQVLTFYLRYAKFLTNRLSHYYVRAAKRFDTFTYRRETYIMKTRIIPQVMCAVIALTIIGCVGSPAWRSMRVSETTKEAQTNNTKMMNLQIGQSKQEVLNIMGPPTKREAYQLENSRTVEFLFYRTTGWSYGETGDKDYQFTPVAIENDKLIGWGRNFYDKVVHSAVDLNVNVK